MLYKRDKTGYFDSEAIRHIKSDRSKDFYPYNLRIHQLCEVSNIMVMMESSLSDTRV